MIIRLVGQGPCLLLGQIRPKPSPTAVVQITVYSVYTSPIVKLKIGSTLRYSSSLLGTLYILTSIYLDYPESRYCHWIYKHSVTNQRQGRSLTKLKSVL